MIERTAGVRCSRTTSPAAARAALSAVTSTESPLESTNCTPARSISSLLRPASIDIVCFVLPYNITLPGIVLGLALPPRLHGTSFLEAVAGVLIGAGILVLIINFWYWLREEEGMGMGDVNMLALVGAFLGWDGQRLPW